MKKKKTVMILSSDEALREIAYLVLTGNYDVWVATTLQQMSRTLTRGINPDLYIIDHDNPERKGCEVIRGIKRGQPKAKYLVITERDVSYDLGNKRNEIDGCCHNADSYLGIPYRGDDLEKTVRGLIGL